MDSDEDEDDDDEAELMAELERIKKERVAERAKKDEEEKEERVCSKFKLNNEVYLLGGNLGEKFFKIFFYYLDNFKLKNWCLKIFLGS